LPSLCKAALCDGEASASIYKGCVAGGVITPVILNEGAGRV